jgi:hypothetical protein
LGFRQLLTVWRAQAFWHLFRNGQVWGTMERQGFGGIKDSSPRCSSLR